MKSCNRILCQILLSASLMALSPQLAGAQMETFTGIGEYTVSDNETLQQGEDNAVKEALRAISEQVGVMVSSNTTIENAVVTQDEIVTFSSSFVKVLNKQVERHMDKDGDIHIRAQVTGNADPDLVINELRQLSRAAAPNRQAAPPINTGANTAPPPVTAIPNTSSPSPQVISPAPARGQTSAKKIPPEYQGALQQAEAHAAANNLSKKGLFRFMLNNGYPRKIATLLSEGADVDWKANALNRANDYLSQGYYSRNGIYLQLMTPNEGFTREEAFYAMTNLSADWNGQALGKARQYQENGMSRDKIRQRLLIEGFSTAEAQYAIAAI